MGVQTIFLSIVVAHTCTGVLFNGSSEHSIAVPVPDEPTHKTNPPDQDVPGPAGRSFNIKQVYITQTDEPIEYIDPDLELPPSDIIPNKTRTGLYTRFKIPKVSVSDDHHVSHLCNSTEMGAAKCNQTKPSWEILIISDEALDFLKGLLVRRVMPSFYILIILISIPLNTLALVTFTCRIRVKKPAVIYMSHLACADLLFTLLLPLKIHYHLNASDWVFGEVACRVLSAAYYGYMYCSILLMMCMSLDRFVAVVIPVASLSWRRVRNAKCICVLVWLLALSGTVPLLSIKQTFKIKNVGVTCHDALFHDDPTEQQYVYLFSILSCLYFILPLVATLASYSTIIYVLNAKSDRLKTSSSTDNRRRAVIMAIAVLTEFVACFAPTNGILLYHCVRLATGSGNGEGDSSYVAYMLAVCAGSSSVFLDPLLYYYGSSQCRQQISSVFWRRTTKRATTLSNTQSQTKSTYLNCEYSQARFKM